MGLTLVYTGEHFVVDILAGWAMTAAVYALVTVAIRGAQAAGRAVRARAAPQPSGTR
jgi:hypothetical protein